MDNYIHIRRGVWVEINNSNDINIINDITHILRYGTVSDLLYACIINEVEGFTHLIKKNVNGIIPYNRALEFISNNYLRDVNSDVKLRSVLIKKLMAI